MHSFLNDVSYVMRYHTFICYNCKNGINFVFDINLVTISYGAL